MDLLREAFDVPVWGSEYTSKTVHCDRILADGEILQLGNQEWTVLITPGHHPGHICLLSVAGLVAGDMVAGIGHPHTSGNRRHGPLHRTTSAPQGYGTPFDVPEPRACHLLA